MSLKFQRENLFPLLDEALVSYAEAQEHSEWVDQELGFETEKVEQRLLEIQAQSPTPPPRQPVAPQKHPPAPRLAPINFQSPHAGPAVQNWIGLPVRTLLTPYTELRLLLERLKLQGGEFIVDLGAGYGRLAFVIGKHHPNVRFCGYELVTERVREGCRILESFAYSQVELKIQDLTETGFELPAADIYFLYDFGSRVAIEKTLQDLRTISIGRKIRVVGRGRASRDAIEHLHPWLSQVNSPQHFAHYSIYYS